MKIEITMDQFNRVLEAISRAKHEAETHMLHATLRGYKELEHELHEARRAAAEKAS